MDVRVATVTLTLRRPACARRSASCASASCCSCACATPTARWAGASRRRWSPTTASRRPRCAPPSRPTRRSCATATATRPPTCSSAVASSPTCPQALAAVDLALWDLAGNREGKPVSELIADDPDTEVRVNATIPAEDRAARRRAGGRRGARGLHVREGQGRHRRRRRPRGRRARRGRRRDGAAPGRQRRLGGRRGRLARSSRSRRRGSSSSRSRCTASSAMRQVRDRVPVRVAMDETAGQPGSLTAKVRRRGVPEGLALRRHLAAAGPGRAGARVRRRRLPRLDLRRAAGHRRRRALRRRAASRPRRAGWRRSSCSPTSSTVLPVEHGAIAVPRAARARRLGARALAATTASGASRGRPWPAPGTTTSSRARAARPRGARPSATNFASRSPTTTVTGIVELAAGGPTAAPSRRCPMPAQRRRPAPRGSLRSRSARQTRAASGGVPANSGCAAQRRRTPRSSPCRRAGEAPRRRRGAPRARPRPRCRPWSRRARSRATRSGAASATCSAIRPPIE